ncbi:MAG: hypothetical protein ACRDP8_14800 [Actinopolymorphaceae bacterium]
MISKREAALNYLVLGLFAAVALFPLLGVLSSALTEPSRSSASLTFPGRRTSRTSPPPGAKATSARTFGPASSSP